MWSLPHTHMRLSTAVDPNVVLGYLRKHVVSAYVPMVVYAHGKCTAHDGFRGEGVLVGFCDTPAEAEFVKNVAARHDVLLRELQTLTVKCILGRIQPPQSPCYLIVHRYAVTEDWSDTPFQYVDATSWPFHDARGATFRVVGFSSAAVGNLLGMLVLEDSVFQHATATLLDAWRDGRLLGLQATSAIDSWRQTRHHEFDSAAQLMCCCALSADGTIDVLWTARQERRRGYGRALVSFVMDGIGDCADDVARWRGPRPHTVDRILREAQPFWEQVGVQWRMVCGEESMYE